MSQALVGIGGVPRDIAEVYLGVGGARRTVTDIYVGINGVPRLFWQNIPPVPTSWVYSTVLTTTGTWVAPVKAWYKIYCVGKSGDGGNGGSGRSTSRGKECGGGGAGGNSGGVSVSTVYLKAGTSVPITVNTATTSFSNLLSATAGGDGGVGATGYMGGGAAGGVASSVIGQGYGGNIANSAGLAGGGGGNGGSYNENSSGDPTTHKRPTAATGVGGNSPGALYVGGTYGTAGGPGGSGNNLQGAGTYYTFVDKNGATNYAINGATLPRGWSSPSALTSPPVLYGSGAGGAGNNAGLNWPNQYNGSLGGLGTPGCIIIERGV